MNKHEPLNLIEKIMIGIILWACLCATMVIGVHAYLALKNEGVNKVQFSIPSTAPLRKGVK